MFQTESKTLSSLEFGFRRLFFEYERNQKMKKVILGLIIFLAGCSTNGPEGSVMEGRRRDFGKGYYAVDVRRKLPEGSPEKYRFSRDLFYKGKNNTF